MSFIDTLKEYLGMSEPPPPRYGLEVRSMPQQGDSVILNNYGYEDRRLPDNYWQSLNRVRGQMVMPSGFTGEIATGPNAHNETFGPIDSQYRTNRLIYPDEIQFPKNFTNPYKNNFFGGPPSRQIFVNGVRWPYNTAPVENNPILTEKRRVIRLNTPAEKAAYLAQQNERGFTLVGEPYTPVTDTRLAPRTMLSTERVPYFNDYRAGSIPNPNGKPYMTVGQAVKYIPHYLANPDVAKELMNKAGNAAGALGVASIIADAYNRATADYENPVTGETFRKHEITNIDGLNYKTADLETIAMFHPDNAENHPEITDEMRKEFFKKK